MQHRADGERLDNGTFAIATRDAAGNSVDAVNMNDGGTERFVVGPWKHGYKLGASGFDPRTHTAWAVINSNGNFGVIPQPVPGHRK